MMRLSTFALGLIVLALGGAAVADPVFENRTPADAPAYTGGWEHFVGGGLATFDCDGDTLPDMFTAGGTSPASLIRNRGDFTFDVIPLPDLTGVTGAYPLDINADGWMDLFVMRVGPNVVLQGGPDCALNDVTQVWGIPAGNGWTTAFSAWWPDDGRPVMAIGNYVDRDNPDGPFGACDDNALLYPDGDGYRSDPLTPGFCPLSMLAARDARGRQTLRISNDRHYYMRNGYEQMWDIGLGRFLTADDGWAKVSLWGMGIASRDLNGDGRDEVMLTSMGDQVLQIAQPDGTYKGAPYSIGTYSQIPFTGDDGRPSTGWHAQFGDIDNDGRADLFIAKGNVDQMPGLAMTDPNNLLIQQPDGHFVEKADVAGVATTARSRGAALTDLDGDGRLDLIVVNRRVPIEIYRNITPDTGHWIAVSLSQSGGNRNAVGAIVRIADQSQQQTVGGGHASGQATPLHFGLGGQSDVDVVVTWPDGSVSHHAVAADQPYQLVKH